MPDKQKLAVYTTVDMKIVRSCGSCAHGKFPRPDAHWGECQVSTYDHTKHGTRPLPAHVIFVCRKWTIHPDLAIKRGLGEYATLLPRT